MIISTLKSKLGVLTITAATALMLLTAGPSIVMAGGEGGAGCGGEDAKYDPAPYIGTLTVKWDGPDGYGLGLVTATGIVEQAGNSGCVGNFNDYPFAVVPFDGEGPPLGFVNWDGKSLRGYCDQNLGQPFGCFSDQEDFQMVAVGGLKWAPDQTSFTAKFVIMHLIYE